MHNSIQLCAQNVSQCYTQHGVAHALARVQHQITHATATQQQQHPKSYERVVGRAGIVPEYCESLRSKYVRDGIRTSLVGMEPLRPDWSSSMYLPPNNGGILQVPMCIDGKQTKARGDRTSVIGANQE